MKRRLTLSVVLVAVLAARSAAEPVPVTTEVIPAPVHIHISSNSTLRIDTEPETEYRLPPGWFMDEPTRSTLDVEMRRLQERETRLLAENESLRKSAKAWSPGWWTLGVAAAAGFLGGVYIAAKY